MKNYKVTLLRKKIKYEVCEMILQASDREGANSGAEYWSELCGNDGGCPPEMEWEDYACEYDHEISYAYVDSIKEVK